MKRELSWLLPCVALLPSLSLADHIIEIRVSAKIIELRGGGSPQGSGDIAQSLDIINDRLDQNGRGYRLVLVDPIISVGGDFDTARPSPSHYAFDNIVSNPGERPNMEADAEANPALWAWNFTALNIYLHGPTQGLECTYPESDLVIIGSRDVIRSSMVEHQIGHFFGLCNSQGCNCSCCGTDDGVRECTSPGSDGIADTLPDLPCWREDTLAEFNFGTTYNNLTAEQRDRVDKAIRNVMSFRGANPIQCGEGPAGIYLTEGQLDRWADAASTSRIGVCDGRTFFVQAGAGGIQTGRSGVPFDRVIEGVTAANSGGDIIMIRAGTYPERLTIRNPVTLRVPRGQTARIGQ
jgi:hypothetical protein